MNREAKAYHPVYNNMAFPDHLDTPARTVTATCTRVSRESVVIEDPRSRGQFRRLTIRERASLQGFPITYQFFAKSFAEKAKMIGNAIPPTFTYLLAQAARGTLAEDFTDYTTAGKALKLPDRVAPVTPPDKEGRSYPMTRSFRAALPNLRFKSGMRFDLSNEVTGPSVAWRVRFFFGPSKDIREIDLDGSVTSDLMKSVAMAELLRALSPVFHNVESKLLKTTPQLLQQAWAHKLLGVGPFDITDHLGELADIVHSRISETFDSGERPALEDFIIAAAEMAAEDRRLVSASKLRKYATWILAGIIVGDWFNSLSWHRSHRIAA
jgi:DNA (cytosine-5)-methyltransferase 1